MHNDPGILNKIKQYNKTTTTLARRGGTYLNPSYLGGGDWEDCN
jgi:hypothetical protein